MSVVPFLIHGIGLYNLKVSITKDDTLLLRGKGDPKEVEKRIAHIEDEIEQSTSDYEKVTSFEILLIF